MIGNIIGIEKNTVYVKLNFDLNRVQNLLNLYVIIEDELRKIIGEIIEIKDQVAYINLLGELEHDNFVYGITHKPSFRCSVNIISKESVPLIIGLYNYDESKDLYFGESTVYDGIKLGVNVNQFFANHFAIFGSTGSGKSCSLARIIQNLFEHKNYVAKNAKIMLFDAYGEYHHAFSELHSKNPQIYFKTYTTDLNSTDSEILQIPIWLLGVDDLALLLNVTSHIQLPIIEKALKYVTIFGKNEEEVIKYKNDIIARAILDILISGKPAPQIRDQIMSVLSTYNTKNLNLDSPITQPGYTRPFKQCLIIDESGKMREMQLITNYIESFLVNDIELVLPDGSFKYTLNDLKTAFDFALISEGILKSDKVYDEANVLKVRLHSLVESKQSIYFNYPEYISLEDYIKKIFITKDGNVAQLVNFNINYIDDRLAKTIAKIYSKMIFEHSKIIDRKEITPYHILLEEAHRYVQDDNDKNLIGYNIFDRITKEGRKYGIILGLISQRPSELSETCISQCSNFLIFKMMYPKDIEYIRTMVPNASTEIINYIKNLNPGVCISFGIAFKVPVVMKFMLPNPLPASESCNISRIWNERNSD